MRDLDKQREKLEGGERENLDAVLKKLHAAHLTWGLLECYDKVCDFPIGKPCMGIIVTEKMDQICERRREALLEEMRKAMIAARRTESMQKLENLFIETGCQMDGDGKLDVAELRDRKEEKLAAVFKVLRAKHQVREPAVLSLIHI